MKCVNRRLKPGLRDFVFLFSIIYEKNQKMCIWDLQWAVLNFFFVYIIITNVLIYKEKTYEECKVEKHRGAQKICLECS